MNVLIFDYIKAPDEAAPFVAPHGQWVKKYIDEGVFYAAGPMKNKLGGVILAKSLERKALLAILAEDPYIIEQVADCRIIAMDFKLMADNFENLQGL